MKILKIIGCFVLIVVIFILAIDFYLIKLYKDPVLSTLPDYSDKVFYEGGSGRGFTDYGKYFYNEKIDFKDNKYFKRVTEEDILSLKEYEKVYREFANKEYFKEDYDFSVHLADTEDYIYIANKDNKESYGIYKNVLDAFDIYYFDVQSGILYFMHSNI